MFSNHKTGRPYFDLVGEVIRENLGLPSAWIQTASDEHIGHSVQVALAVTVEDTGDGESGPSVSFDVSRFVDVYDDEQNRWHLRLFDLTLAGPDDEWCIDVPPVATLDLPDIAGEHLYERVGQHVADVLRTMFLKYQNEEHIAPQVS